MKRELDPNHLGEHEDWYGNNAAFLCPFCRNVFIVCGFINRHGRLCPVCGKAKGFVQGKPLDGHAWIEPF
ncbi:MAG TPA: hypothetical protein VG944_09495 [Fimbriimonas sp.]|nr:hypothetical protein [Fimbriimonas sp.]